MKNFLKLLAPDVLEDFDILMATDSEEELLMHYGVGPDDNPPGRGSGRYPVGSGENPYQREDLYSAYNRLKKEGLKEKEIAEQLKIYDKFGKPNTTTLRALYSIAKAERRGTLRNAIMKLKDEEPGISNSEIGRRLSMAESTVRSLMDEGKAIRNDLTRNTMTTLKQYVDENRYVDITSGTNNCFGVTQNRFDTAVAMLEQQGYKKQYVLIDQMGTNHKTTIKVLTPPDVSYGELSENRYDIKNPAYSSKLFNIKGDITAVGDLKPTIVSSDRVQIKYNEEGGLASDGLIEVRRNVPELSLGKSQYAQVRIAVDDHYLKGMCRYADDLPDGIDIRFNTNKHLGTPIMNPEDKHFEVLKPLKRLGEGSNEIDWANPFGSAVKQKTYIGPDGKEYKSAINIVNDAGTWKGWEKSLPSQFLSKQPYHIAEHQLKLSFLTKKDELDEIKSITNPTLKKRMLIDFADKCDSAAVDLQAAPFKGQQYHVLMPYPNMKDDECYCTNYKDGTKVALVRFPHQDPSEIPILTVRNRGSIAEKDLKNAPDAIGVNKATADRLSGADYDGDAAVVIPLSETTKVRNAKVLKQLEGFDPKEEYAYTPGIKVMTAQQKGIQMGVTTNLLTDMRVKGCSDNEAARVIRHAQVVIDAEKHALDWQRSEKENHIQELKDIYQKNPDGTHGASTLISRAKGVEWVNARKDWYPSEKTIGPNGEKIPIYTNETYKTGVLLGKTKKAGEVIINTDPKTNEWYYLKKNDDTGKRVRVPVTEADFKEGSIVDHVRKQKSTQMAETSDAYKLTSGGSRDNPGSIIERVYADYANNMKSLANTSRLEWLKVKDEKKDPQAAIKYKAEVDSLLGKLAVAKANAPLERQAQLISNMQVDNKKSLNPNMSSEDLKKYKGNVIRVARDLAGAGKKKIEVTEREYEAIKNHALSPSKLNQILDNANLDTVKKYAMPRGRKITDAMKARIRVYANSGLSNADIAEQLHISQSSVSDVLNA